MSNIGFAGVANYAMTTTATAVRTMGVTGVGSSSEAVQGPSLGLNFLTGPIGGPVLDPRITFTRSTTATRVNSSGLIESVAINDPRFDYDPVTLAPKGLLIEEQRTNLALYSEELDTGWTNGAGATWQYSSGVSPAGTTTALGVDGLAGVGLTSTGTTLYRVGNAISGSTAYTFSIFVRAKTGTANNVALRMSETGGNNTVSTPFTVTTAWTRISMSVTSAAGATSVTIAVGTSSGTADLFIWGAQLEAGAFATSYNPTEASQVTRAADSAVMTGTNFSSWYNATEGTMFSEASTYDVSAARIGFAISDGTASNRIQAGNGGGARGFVSAGGVTQMTQALASVTFSNNTASKVSLAYELNNGNAAANGTIGTLDTAMTIPVVTQARIGGLTTTQSPLNGHVRRIAYYPRRLANAELQAITA